MNTSTTGSLLFDGIIPFKKKKKYFGTKRWLTVKKKCPVINRHYALENVFFKMTYYIRPKNCICIINTPLMSHWSRDTFPGNKI